jgi:hypothetical protein
VRLSDAQIELYSRQIILREIGGSGQRKLLAGRCLVVGRGAAAELALSYLVGAGVGTIDLVACGDDVPAALPLASLARRGPDSVVRCIAGSQSPATLDGYDVVLIFRDAAEDGGDGELQLARPRVGLISVRTAGDGSILVLLVPNAAGCSGCVAAAGSAGVASGDGGRTADVVGLAAAGGLAALACCRWLAEIACDPEARVLRLAHGSALWVEGAIERRTPCPRGCPVRAEPL